jgi:hypothetical protein
MTDEATNVSATKMVKDVLDSKKGALYTLKKTFLAPWRAFDAFTKGTDKALVSPFKILLAILPIMAAFEFVFPNDQMMEALLQELAHISTAGYEAGYESASGQQLTEQELKARYDQSLEENAEWLEFLGEYPIVSLLLNVIIFAVGLKVVYFKRLSAIESAYLSAYMIVPTTIISSGILYSWLAINGFDSGLLFALGASQILYMILMLVYLFQVGKSYYGHGAPGAVIRTVGVLVIMQLIPIAIGAAGAAIGLVNQTP